jgi:hypothetical protein
LRRYDSGSDDDDEDDEEEYEIEEPVDGESQDDHDNRMLNFWYPACDRLVAKHPYLVLFDPILPHDTTRCLAFRYCQVMAYYTYLESCVFYCKRNGSIRYAQEIARLDLQRDEFDEFNYNLITGFDWDEDDLGELYFVIGGTYFRENEFMDDETEDGETQVEDDEDEDEDDDEDDEAEDDEDGETQVEDEDDMDVVDGEDVETQVKDDEDRNEI